MERGTLPRGVSGLSYIIRLRFNIWVFVANYAGPAQLSGRLNKAAANWTATGNLDFLNTWCVVLFPYCCESDEWSSGLTNSEKSVANPVLLVHITSADSFVL